MSNYISPSYIEQVAKISGTKVIAMFKVCLDESGINDSSKYCVVAGYVGGLRQWIALEKSWSCILNKFGVEYFHSKDFFAKGKHGRFKEPYKDWDENKLKDFIDQLITTILSRKIHLVGAVIEKPAFESLNHNEKRFLTGGAYNTQDQKWKSSGKPSEPYFVPFHWAVFQSLNKTPTGQVVQFFCDEQDNFEGWAVQFYKQTREFFRVTDSNLYDKLGPLSFDSKLKVVGLQVADLPCYLWRRYAEFKGKIGHQQNYVMNRLIAKDNSIQLMEYETLKKYLGMLPEEFKSVVLKNAS